MHLNQTNPEGPGYFVRAGADAPERGPLKLDDLRDLAEFRHITMEFLVRPPEGGDYRPFADLPELAAMVFPRKSSFRFKQYEKKEDADAGYAPVDVKEMYRCETAGVAPASRTGEPNPPAVSGHDPVVRATAAPAGGEKFHMQEVLRASQALVQRVTSGGRHQPRPPFSAGRVFRAVRWVCAIFLVMLGGAMLNLGATWQMAILPFGAAFLLIALDLVGWGMDAVDGWVGNAAEAPVDYSRADDFFRNENWQLAADEYWAIVTRHPREVRAYLAGMAAAVAAGEESRTGAFHALAQSQLSHHDLNLLNGSLHRRGLPQVAVPPVDKPKAGG